MKKKLRWYQEEASQALFDELVGDKTCHPLAVLPTGAGKSLTLCDFTDKWISAHPQSKVLVLSHVAEILEQDHDALQEYFEGIEIGLYSSGLDSKTIKKITVAGIQSVHRKPELFAGFDIIIIDECHLIPMKDDTMYRRFLDNMDSNYVGLTATHFRLGHGYIHKGKNALFTKIVYDLSKPEQMARLVEEGYLSELITKNTHMRLNPDAPEAKIRKLAGDYNMKDASVAFDREYITSEAVKEIIKFGRIYKLWLVFAIDIEHAKNIANTFRVQGIKTACVHSELTKAERKEIMRDIKSGVYRAVVNVDILTTGFDAPRVDLIAMLRPTQSPVIHVQAIGRGLRVAEGKDCCLVLDFAGNTSRLGTIDDVKVKQKGEAKPGGTAVVKECPNKKCMVVNHGAAKNCIVCGEKFIFQEKILESAGTKEVMKKNKKKLVEWVDVKDVTYSLHQKSGSPNSLRVNYKAGFMNFSEWVCFDHKNFAGYNAKNWVKYRLPSTMELPKNVTELLKISDKLAKPKRIYVDNTTKFASIKNYEF
jgi:DNA repair protein RadD